MQPDNTTAAKLPVIDKIEGKQFVVCEGMDGGFIIAATGIAAHFYKDGDWHLADSTDETPADEWTWPSHQAAIDFIRATASKEPTTPAPAGEDVVQSKSLLKRQAVQRGEEIPSGYVTMLQYEAELDHLRREIERLEEQAITDVMAREALETQLAAALVQADKKHGKV